jgi:methylase of polypeptide subunit release factors
MQDQSWYRTYVSSWGNEEPSQFASAFARTIPIAAGETRLLDVGCGSGIIGIYCLMEKQARSVTFSDIEPLWLEIARNNVAIQIQKGVISPSQVRFLRPASFAELPYGEVASHDLVAFNPPQLPYAYLDPEVRQRIDGDPIEQRFRRGGEWGLEIVGNFLNWYASLPVPKPDAIILVSSFLGRKRIGETIALAGLQPSGKPIETDAPLRPIFWKQADALSRDTDETEDRLIRKVRGAWYKKLLTYRLTNITEG